MAVDIFIKIGDVKGESQDKTHKEEIEVLAWSWGMSQSGTMHMGTGGGAGKVNVQDFSFTKYLDKATPILMGKCATGQHFDKTILTVRKAGGDNPLEYFKITFEGVLISSISEGGSGGEDRFTENITLNFEKYHVEYQPQSAKGEKEGGVVETKWDIPKNATS
jgi:type VI secretion system secreted protein Hcp